MKQEHEGKQQEKVSPDMSAIMIKALLEQKQPRNIGEETASRMRSAVINFDHEKSDKTLDRYEAARG